MIGVQGGNVICRVVINRIIRCAASSDDPFCACVSTMMTVGAVVSTAVLCVLILISSGTNVMSAFTPSITLRTRVCLVKRERGAGSSLSVLSLWALTERQMQFWEDVEDGLDDIEKFYAEKGQSIDRIRAFGRSARGETPAPAGNAPGHQPSEEHVDGLTAKPFWDVVNDPVNFPWAAKLEANSDVITKEFEHKLASESAAIFSGDSAWQNNVMGGGWAAFRLQRLGKWNVENCGEFPQTYKLLRSLNIPIAVRGVCFARQQPQSGVQPHSDGRNFILTSHLGLKIPKGCWIRVGEEERSWEEGKLTTLDTSFEHSTGNPTDSERHVLIIDFWHPELTEAERAALEFVYDLRNKFESGEVPFRKPRSLEQEGKGLAGLWNAMTGGGK